MAARPGPWGSPLRSKLSAWIVSECPATQTTDYLYFEQAQAEAVLTDQLLEMRVGNSLGIIAGTILRRASGIRPRGIPDGSRVKLIK